MVWCFSEQAGVKEDLFAEAEGLELREGEEEEEKEERRRRRGALTQNTSPLHHPSPPRKMSRKGYMMPTHLSQ
jgi:hypothetical protein